ncbi:hypothetical protein JM93_03055 [Roseibium hamelinense]|uniref:Uncharacterized protein n=2 Tax=Roseibium hamelinense TaxID=150831 RepID=A0A562SVJ5_9HYPH|nr:hypothetical protein JM93_03055 [Roseibium hamelinense]
MERLGMRREAHFKEHALFKGSWDEEYYYALLAREWAAGNCQTAFSTAVAEPGTSFKQP